MADVLFGTAGVAMMARSCHVVFAGGGTGGHVFPALAVAEALGPLLPGARMTFVGTGRPWERVATAAAGLEYCPLPSHPWPRRPAEAWRFVRDNLAGFCAGQWLLTAGEATVVVGCGGYASAPVARAAARAGVPLVLLEANAAPGRVTRWLAPRAALVVTAFAAAADRLRARGAIECLGIPVRQALLAAVRRRQQGPRSAGRRRLLVLGGSGGSAVLNQWVPRAVYKAGPEVRSWSIVHQAGRRDTGQTAALYRKLGVRARVVPFLQRLPELLPSAGLVISRAGGSALAELALAEAAAIIVPFRGAADDHQHHNAQALADAGACTLVPELDDGGRLDERLSAVLARHCSEPALRATLAGQIGQFARPGAAQDVAQHIVALALSYRQRAA